MTLTEKQSFRLTTVTVWLSRLIVGATFVISGWSKSIDPWGFIYKLEEYFNVWGLEIPREITLAIAIVVSVSEFGAGVMILTGAMRRASVWVAAAFMLVMLPLTIYVAIADPVSDCGCFGEFILLSNSATLIKNIILTGLIIFLMLCNSRVGGLLRLGVQGVALAGALFYAVALVFIGYRYQPLVDFRKYPIGVELTADALEDGTSLDSEIYIYKKEGIEQKFELDNLPDSTWTFVRAELGLSSSDDKTLVIYDEDEDVTASVLDGEGEQLLLAVTDPGMHYLTRARLANELARIVDSRGGKMIGLVAAEGDRLEGWSQLALPEYDIYSVEDTSLKELVRGDAGLVYVVDGRIIWKRNLASVSHETPGKIISDDGFFFGEDVASDQNLFYDAITYGLIGWIVLLIIVPLVIRRKT